MNQWESWKFLTAEANMPARAVSLLQPLVVLAGVDVDEDEDGGA